MLRHPHRVIFSVLLTSFLAGGAGGTGTSRTSRSGDETPTRNSVDLAALPLANRTAFEVWKGKLAKNCDASEIFGLTVATPGPINAAVHEPVDGIDARVLLDRNGGSLVFIEAGDRLVALAPGARTTGTRDSVAEVSRAYDGETRTISATAHLDANGCEVTLGGEKILLAPMVPNLAIVAEWAPGKLARVPGRPAAARSIGKRGFYELARPEIGAAIKRALHPRESAIESIAERLGLLPAEASRFLSIGSLATGSLAVRPEPLGPELADHNPWSIPENIVATSAEAARLRRSGTMGLELRATPLRFAMDGIDPEDDARVWQWHIIVQRTPAGAWVVSHVEFRAGVPESEDESMRCVATRASAYRGGDTSQIVPTVDHLLAPCRVLHREIGELVYDRGTFRSLIADQFSGIVPAASVVYGGWDEVITRLSLEVYGVGHDLHSELDPTGKTTVIAAIASNLVTIDEALDHDARYARVRDPLDRLGIGWALRGLDVSATRVGDILDALGGALDPFWVSSLGALETLRADPNGAVAELAFAHWVDEHYRETAVRTLNSAKAIGYDAYGRDVFDRVLQRQVPISVLEKWAEHLGLLETIFAANPVLGLKREFLVERSLDWLRTGTLSPTELTSVLTGIARNLGTFPESTDAYIAELGRDVRAQGGAIAYAGSVTDAEKTLALDVQNDSATAGYPEIGAELRRTFLQARPDTETLRFAHDFWSAAAAFTERENDRTKGDAVAASENAWKRRALVERGRQEGWDGSEFAKIETLAGVARARSECSRFRAVSGLVECIGSSRFARGPGGLLDPRFGSRYVELAGVVSAALDRLASPDGAIASGDLVDAFYGVQWATCDDGAFYARKLDLEQRLSALLLTTDPNDRLGDVGRLRDTLSDCD